MAGPLVDVSSCQVVHVLTGKIGRLHGGLKGRARQDDPSEGVSARAELRAPASRHARRIPRYIEECDQSRATNVTARPLETPEAPQPLGPWLTPNLTASLVNEALGTGQEVRALRLILQARDDVCFALGPNASATTVGSLVGAWQRRHLTIRDERFDVLLRAVVAHALGEQAPAWTVGARLEWDWVVSDPFRDEAQVRAQTPAWLAKARVYIAERGLTTA